MTDKIGQARRLAIFAHRGQFRKFSGQPYIVHPLQVHSKVKEFLDFKGFDKDDPLRITIECAALLHDVPEDCDHISGQQIIDATDEAVYQMALELKNPSIGVKAPRKVRKQMDRDHLKAASWGARVIKCKDRTCNLGDLSGCPDRDYVLMYADESQMLLDEALRGTDETLEFELQGVIEMVRHGK